MRFQPVMALLFGICWIVDAHAESGKAMPRERGVYAGTGRACAGQLRITADRISWTTPFSRCAASPFTVKDRQENKALRVTYQLLQRGPRCRYEVLMLAHDGGSEDRIGWNVVGFPSMSAYDPERPEAGLSCYLVK
jgi:hypothetical protein